MPFEFRISFAAQFIEFDKYVENLRRELRRMMRQAAAIYYTNIMFTLPVDTGFLAGSFASIKTASGAVANPQSPNPQRRRQFYTHFGDRKTEKNLLTGTIYTTKPEDILTEISDQESRLLYVFLFNNEIRYYPINDVHGVRGRAPWRITEGAIRVALAFINTNLPKILPDAISASVRSELISYKPGAAPQRIKVRT